MYLAGTRKFYSSVRSGSLKSVHDRLEMRGHRVWASVHCSHSKELGGGVRIQVNSKWLSHFVPQVSSCWNIRTMDLRYMSRAPARQATEAPTILIVFPLLLIALVLHHKS